MDTSRSPPPQGPPPAYALVTRVYKRSLRPVVIFSAGLTAIWTLAAGVNDFRMLGYDRQYLPHITPFAIALGSLYMAAFVCSALGMAAAVTQRLPLIRAFAYLGPASALFVVATNFVEVITHFMYKNELLNDCKAATTGDTVFFSWGLWGPVDKGTLSAEDAVRFCQRAYDHDSWSTIVALLFVIVFAGFYSSLALSYLRQTLDPSTMRTATRVEAHPVHYAPPYSSQPNLSYPPQGFAPPYGAPTQGYAPYGGSPAGYAPPAGPPPPQASSDALPGYGYGAGAGAGAGAGRRDDDKKDDPFADFEEVPHTGAQERDVTSRPAPGGPARFGV